MRPAEQRGEQQSVTGSLKVRQPITTFQHHCSQKRRRHASDERQQSYARRQLSVMTHAVQPPVCLRRHSHSVSRQSARTADLTGRGFKSAKRREICGRRPHDRKLLQNCRLPPVSCARRQRSESVFTRRSLSVNNNLPQLRCCDRMTSYLWIL